LHADIGFRQRLIQELCNVSGEQALNLIHSIDKDRGNFLRKFTGKNWLDSCQYHLSLDTSAVGLDQAENIILDTLEARFKDVKATQDDTPKTG
jgi:hypothetical protein